MSAPSHNARPASSAASVALPTAAEAAQLNALFSEGRMGAAAAEAKRLAARYPGASLPSRLLGVIAARKGAVEEAIAHFEAAIDGVPREREPYENLGRLLVREGRQEAAEDLLHRLAEAFPGERTFTTAMLEVDLRFAQRRIEAAREAVLDALDLEPDNDAALQVFGFVLDHTKATEPSDRYRRAIARLLRHPELMSRTDHMAACFLVGQAIEALDGDTPQFSALPDEIREMLRLVLFHRFAPVLGIERLLISLRRQILERVAASETGEGVSAENADLVEAMARHAYTTEYLWDETPEEAALLDVVRTRVEQRLATGAPLPARELFALGAYRDLSTVPAVRNWVAGLVARDPASVDPTLELLVFNPMAEASIARALPALTPIDDAVSTAVQAQYEQNPYPRWRTIRALQATPYLEHIQTVIRPHAPALASTVAPGESGPRVLIAGCGTGQHPIGAARTYAGAQVLAVDLSRASLAYAARQAIGLEVKNIQFAQADILKLPEIEQRFDVVEAGGVIHHMRDPEEGLRALLSVLKPGGYLKLGLYSQIARRDISRARAFIAEKGYAPDLDGIRAFRRDYLAGAIEEIGDFSNTRDFYHTSDLRDLVFHVQEHQLTLPGIDAMLGRNGLTFLGFSDLPAQVRDSYAAETPGDAAQTDLAGWHAFEERHPRTFVGMYQFWSQKG